MKETIAQMLKVEAEAKQTVTSARDEAESIIRKARAEAAAIQEEARRAAREKAARLVEQGLKDVRDRRAELLRQADLGNERLRTVTESKAEAARELILAALTGR